MDIRKIKKLIELLEESGIAEIEIKEGEEAVRISRMRRRRGRAVAAAAGRPVGGGGCRRCSPRPRAQGAGAPKPKANEHVITAPMVGTFYAAPRPGRSPSSRSATRSKSARCCASSRR